MIAKTFAPENGVKPFAIMGARSVQSAITHLGEEWLQRAGNLCDVWG